MHAQKYIWQGKSFIYSQQENFSPVRTRISTMVGNSSYRMGNSSSFMTRREPKFSEQARFLFLDGDRSINYAALSRESFFSRATNPLSLVSLPLSPPRDRKIRGCIRNRAVIKPSCSARRIAYTVDHRLSDVYAGTQVGRFENQMVTSPLSSRCSPPYSFAVRYVRSVEGLRFFSRSSEIP